MGVIWKSVLISFVRRVTTVCTNHVVNNHAFQQNQISMGNRPDPHFFRGAEIPHARLYKLFALGQMGMSLSVLRHLCQVPLKS